MSFAVISFACFMYSLQQYTLPLRSWPEGYHTLRKTQTLRETLYAQSYERPHLDYYRRPCCSLAGTLPLPPQAKRVRQYKTCYRRNIEQGTGNFTHTVSTISQFGTCAKIKGVLWYIVQNVSRNIVFLRPHCAGRGRVPTTCVTSKFMKGEWE